MTTIGRKHRWVDDNIWSDERIPYRYHRGQPNYKPKVPSAYSKKSKTKM